MPYLSRSSAIVLTPLLALWPLYAQENMPAPLPTGQAVTVQNLHLQLVRGGVSQPGVVDSRGLFVEVTDARGAAVAGVSVSFRLPDEGVTGAFPDGSRAFTMTTDERGRAGIGGIRWSPTPGTVVVRVTATMGDAHAGMLVEERLGATASNEMASSVKPGTPQKPPASGLPQHDPSAVLAQNTEPTRPATIAPPKVSITTARMGRTGASSGPEPAGTSPIQTASSMPPVTIADTGAKSTHGGKTKWIILAAVVTAGATGGLILMGGKSKATPAAPTGPTIGAPTISVGAP